MALKNKVFHRSLLLSVCLHAAMLLLLQYRSPRLYGPQAIHPPETSRISIIEKRKKDQILREAFENPVSSQAFSSDSCAPSQEPLVTMPAPKLPLPPPPKKMSPSSIPLELLPHRESVSFSLPRETKIDLFEHLPKDLILPVPSTPPVPLFPSPVASTRAENRVSPPLDVPLVNPSFENSPPSRKILPIKTLSFAFSPHLAALPTLEELETSSYSEAFDTELVFFPKEEEEEGYFFALTLIPRPDLELPKLRQHFSFLIDRSNSIQRERLNAGKNAIKRALLELGPEDTFNIIAFDSKIEKFSPTALSVSKRNLHRAKDFLDTLQLGSFFSPGDLYKPLFLTVPSKVDEDEVHTTILFTDGETLSKKSAQYALLNDWTAYNQGRVTLFGVSLASDLHLGTLDAAAAFNRGKLLASPTKRGLKRKLLKLMKTLQAPVAKNLTCKAISRSPSSQIVLFTKTTPHLYLKEPYVILGRTNSLEDFIFFVQGRLKDRWLNIKKPISFINARKGGEALKAEWALQRAYQLYEQHLRDHNQQHLSEAREILAPYDLESAFQ